MKITDSVQNEYWFHVADQIEIPIAGEVGKSIDLNLLDDVIRRLPADDRLFPRYLIEEIQKQPSLIDVLRTLIGVSDKRMYLELSYLFSKARFDSGDQTNILGYSIYDLQKKPLTFFKSLVIDENTKLRKAATKIIFEYFNSRELLQVMRAISKVNTKELIVLVDNLILTKEVQQAEAKRRGHGAEFEVAKVLHLLGVSMIPDERHLRPIGFYDPNVDRLSFEISKKSKSKTWSFDLIVLNSRNESHAFVQSLIHTSDPGQYGVNKSDETILIKNDLNLFNKKTSSKKELWGIVDGVGFCENKKDTIDKMLSEFDCFIQMKSIYKIALQLHRAGIIKVKAIAFDTSFYSKTEQDCMYAKYCDHAIQNVTGQKVNSTWTPVSAGKAVVYL